MHFHIVKMYKDKEVNKNVKNIFFIYVWRKIVFDICFTGFGTTLTTILPVLFQYCYKYCYSDSRNLWVVMKAGGLALWNLIQPTVSLEMTEPSQDHYGFHSIPVFDWLCLFIYLWVLTFLCKIIRSSVILLLPLFKAYKYHTVQTVPQSNIKRIERGKIATPETNAWPLTFLAWYRHFNKKKWCGWDSFMGANLSS